jgi:hypothetical protein
MSRENPLWGAPWIHGELLMPGIEVAESSVSRYMVRRRRPRPKVGTLDQFLAFRPSPSPNRSRRASGMDGTASLANRDFGRVLRTNRRKVVSPLPRITQMKPQAQAIPPIRVENLQRRDSLAEGAGFEPSVPLPSLAK